MSSSSYTDALDALLAESTAASVGSAEKQASSVGIASKSENAFVSFDAVVANQSAISSAAVGGFASRVDEVVLINQGQDVLNAPHLVLVGKGGRSSLCKAVPASVAGAKWCFDSSNCSAKTHAKAEKFDIKPNLYVKASGKGKLAYVTYTIKSNPSEL